MNRKNHNRLNAAVCAVFFGLQPCFAHAELVPIPAENAASDDIDVILSGVANPFNARLVYQTAARITRMFAPMQATYSMEPSPQLRNLIEDGIRKMEQEDFAGAMTPLGEARNLSPPSEELLYALGTSLLFTGRDQEAEAVLRSAIRVAPWRSKTWTALAISFANQGKQDAAASALVLAHEWSSNKQETFATFKNKAQHAQSEALRALYKSVLPRTEHRMTELDRSKRELEAQEAARKDTQTPAAPDKNGVPNFRFETCVKPEYPVASIKREEQGVVTLAFLIDTDGQFVDTLITKSSGYANLDYIAQFSLSTCGWNPSLKEEVPVKAWTKAQYVWKLE